MKKNNKGFVLIETLIVSVVVISILFTLYLQIRKISDNNTRFFKQNRTSDIMLLENFGNYLYETEILNQDIEYIDLTDCTNVHLTSRNLCSYLISISEIDNLILTKNNIKTLKDELIVKNYPNEFKDYIKKIKNTYDENGYRLIAYFNNGTMSNIVIKG
ncbi:MAG: hypothetical protein IJZ36_03655, partial [Bacilli bacterium]|nr:hypothetical protein [Bacilli bacterium]